MWGKSKNWKLEPRFRFVLKNFFRYCQAVYEWDRRGLADSAICMSCIWFKATTIFRSVLKDL